MAFREEVAQFASETESTFAAVFDTTVELTKQSIQFGSEITGAPGQPVRAGALRNSWMREDLAPFDAIIGTNMPYAEPIENGVGPHGPLTLRSAVGGFESVAQTTTNFDRIVDAAVAAHAGDG